MINRTAPQQNKICGIFVLADSEANRSGINSSLFPDKILKDVKCLDATWEEHNQTVRMHRLKKCNCACNVSCWFLTVLLKQISHSNSKHLQRRQLTACIKKDKTTE